MISATKNVGLKLPHRLVTGQGHGNLISESSSGLRMTNSLQSERPRAGAMKIRFRERCQRMNPGSLSIYLPIYLPPYDI